MQHDSKSKRFEGTDLEIERLTLDKKNLLDPRFPNFIVVDGSLVEINKLKSLEVKNNNDSFWRT